MPDNAHRLGRERAMQLAIARGHRSALTTRTAAKDPEFGPYRHLAGILHPSLDDVFTAEPDGGEPAPAHIVEASRRVHEATWQHVKCDILHTWYPMPRITDVHHPNGDRTHPLAARLGATPNALHEPLTAPSPPACSPGHNRDLPPPQPVMTTSASTTPPT